MYKKMKFFCFVSFQITDEGRNVFAIEVPEDQLDEVSRSMYSHLRTLIQERDGYVEVRFINPF